MTVEFHREMLGRWQNDPQFEKAYLLWVAYYWQTEEFDRFMCGGVLHPEFGVALLPTWGVERDACNRNARILSEWVLYKSRLMLISKDKIKVARRAASVNSHERNEEILLKNGKDPWHESAQYLRYARRS